MQYNTPQQERRPTRTDAATPSTSRPRKDYAPKKRKSQAQKVLPLLLLFSALLIAIYLISPKEAGRRVGGSRFDGLVISEVMAANNSAVPDENGEFHDWLELYNGTGADLDMEGVMITNRTDRITFPFPSYTLKAGERVVVFASDSYQLDPSKPFHGKFKISSAGDHLYLYDPDMYLIDELATPTLTADTSYALTGIDEDGVRHYETTTYYSPGYENTEEGFVEYRSANSVESGALVINNPAYNERAEILREKGTNRAKFFRGQVDKYTWVDFGDSYLPSELNAAYLWAQLLHADDINHDRMASWDAYRAAFQPLADAGKVELPTIPADCVHNAHMFYLKCKDLEERTALIQYLKEQGVMAVFHYIPLHSAPAGLKFGRFDGEDRYTTRESERLVRLPLYYGLTPADRDKVIEHVLGFYNR